MRCTFRAAVAVACGLLFVLFATPVANATERLGTLTFERADGKPGEQYKFSGTNVPCPGGLYSLKFANQKQQLHRESSSETAPSWSSTVPTDAQPGPNRVELYCTPVVIRAIGDDTLLATGIFNVLETLRTADVPVLVGSTEEEAKAALEDVGLQLGKVSGGTGTVVGQVPDVGTSLPLGSPVDIELAVVVVLVSVPNLIGRTVTQARALLKPNGLKLVGATRSGRVATQSPEPGATVERGSSVRVTLRPIVAPSSPAPSRSQHSTSPPSSSTVRPTPSLTSGGSPTVPPGEGGQSGGWILLGASGGAGGLLVLASAVLLSRTAIRVRERQWIRQHVHAEPRLGDVEPPEVRTDPRFPSSAVRLEPHQDPGTHTVEEERR